ncbi:MAG: hypothetical protein LBQ73_09850, partial [Tannerellaceae bacterium]|nr:hypothetical protein [Tannerellaceae bacterium]
MFNYYLFNKSYEDANIQEIEFNLQDLNDLVVTERKEDDSFFKHDSIWETLTLSGTFADVVFNKLEDKHLSNIILPKLFQAIDTLQHEIQSFEEFDASYKIYNAFYGIHFTESNIQRYITDKTTYTEFRNKNLWEVTPESFWERRHTLFSRIVFCESVENDIKTIGGTYLQQIIKKLKELDRYVAQYGKDEAFNYHDANTKTALNISPESTKTMQQSKYYRQRLFSLPDGRRECFELHIKTKHLRFHLFP